MTSDVTSVAPLSSPTEPPIEPPSETGSIPLTWNDARFSGCTTSNSVTVQNGATLSSKSITDTGHTASIILGSGGATVRTCRVNSRESVRVGASGTFNIDNCYLEATGQGDDHADTVQHYSPGSRGTVRVTNTSIVAHNTAATAGFFVADNWTGTFELTNVVIQGGPYGCRIHRIRGAIISLDFETCSSSGRLGMAHICSAITADTATSLRCGRTFVGPLSKTAFWSPAMQFQSQHRQKCIAVDDERTCC